MTRIFRSYPVAHAKPETSARLGASHTRRAVAVRSIRRWAALGAMVLLSAPIVADVEIRSTTTDHSADPARRDQGATLVSDGNLRTQLEIQQGDSKRLNTTIYRGDSKDFLVVDHRGKTFTQFDEAGIEELKAQLGYSMLQLDQKLADMPLEQRKLFQQSLQASAPKPTRVIATEDIAEKSGFTCKRVEVRAGDELVREVWVASWDQIPEGDAVRNAMEGLETFFMDLNQAFESITSSALGGAKVFDLGDNPVQDLSRLGGLPIVTRNFQQGKLVTETVVEKITPRSLEKSDFAAPPNYQRRSVTGQ